MKRFLLLFLSFLYATESFLTYRNVPPKRRVQVYESPQKPFNETHCVIFLGGGSNSISHRIYDGFLTSLQNKNISVFVPCFNYQHMPYMLRILNRRYKDVTMIGHSSGCNTALNHCKQKGVSKLILMDPVKTSYRKRFLIPFVRTIHILRALKSYQINYNPFGLPFIPHIFRITAKNIMIDQHCKIHQTDVPEYGHSDVLEPEFSNVMHFTRITVGHKNRTHEHLHHYHEKLSEYFSSIIKNPVKINYPTCLP